MGKTFEPVTLETVRNKSLDNPLAVNAYDENVSRIGRNFFRNPHDPSFIQLAGTPALEKFWKLKDRPMSVDAQGFDGELLAENLEKEKNIPYEKTGGYPMIGGATPIGFCLDEIVEIAEGLYLGQLIYSTLLAKPYHSSEDSSVYGYQLFGYFMLMDNDWEYHRQAIKLDTLT